MRESKEEDVVDIEETVTSSGHLVALFFKILNGSSRTVLTNNQE